MSSIEAFDIVIVGGGAAGCVLARRLSEPGDRTVLLIEAGPDPRALAPRDWWDGWRLPTVPDWGFRSEPDASGASGPLRRGRVLGGTSWLTRFAVRGAAADFDAWAQPGDPGWSFDGVLTSFRRLESDAEFGDHAWHGMDGPVPITRYADLAPSDIHAAAIEACRGAGFAMLDDLNAPDPIGIGRVPMSSQRGIRVTAADAYLPIGGLPPGLTVRPDSMVARIAIENARATAVELTDGSVIHGGRIIIAAGTYGSPTILMRSGIGPADHLASVAVPVAVDLPGVGANLADHPGIDLDTGWRGIAAGGPVLHSIATFRSSTAPNDGPPDLMFWLSDPDGEDAGFWLDPILLKPRSRGTVRLRSADPDDPPRITLPGIEDATDLDRLAEGYRLALDLASRPGIRRLCRDDPPTTPGDPRAMRQRLVENAYSIPHVVGTCRMGPSPGGGDVVDAMGRVHGVDGLSVIDASIIPEAPSGFPHVITMMLAEHLSAAMARTGI